MNDDESIDINILEDNLPKLTLVRALSLDTINISEEDTPPKLTLVRALARDKSIAQVTDEYQKMATLR